MVWSDTQRYRLAVEKEKLESLFPSSIQWIDPTDATKVQVTILTNSGRSYVLRVCLAPDFPNSCPKLQIVSPPNLLMKNGKPIPQMSTRFHTLQDVEKLISICHFYPPDWTDENTLYQIFMKGRIWLEAYEAHLDTGLPMDRYLGEMKHRQTRVNSPVVVGAIAATSTGSLQPALRHSRIRRSQMSVPNPQTTQVSVDGTTTLRNTGILPTSRGQTERSEPARTSERSGRHRRRVMASTTAQTEGANS